MKKVLLIVLSLALALGSLTACGDSKPNKDESKANNESTAATGEKPEGDVKVVLICDPVGTNPFLTQMVAGLKDMEDKYPNLKTTVTETPDSAAWEDNIRAAVLEEGYDVIIVGGSAGTDPITAVADQFPEDATYILIDDESPSANVKSITFNEQEGAYLIGMIAALVNETDKFGGVHANENQSSYKWRWGYMEGAKAVRPELTEDNFVFNYTNSYTDAPKAKELALQQAADGCGFINAASAVADFGTFEAAKENKFYTSGQDQDRTDKENPYIITTQIKDTSVVIEKVITEYMEGTLTYEHEAYGVKEGVIGALFVTHDSEITERNSEVFTDEMVAQVKEAADKIANGEIVLEVPMENE